MTIHRKILKVKTVGSRQTGDLRPKLSDTLPIGFNYAVLEYDEVENTCIVECWCSDHPLHEKPKTKADLDEISNHSTVLEGLQSHSKSPPILGSIAISFPETINEAKKEITSHGKTGKFLRKIKIHTTTGEEQDEYILDEG